MVDSLFPPPRARSFGINHLADLVNVVVYFARDLARQPGHRLELLAARLQEALWRAEVLEQQPLARGADAGELVEDRAGHRAVASAAVELDREAVSLVAHSLQQLQGRRVVREHHGGLDAR